MLRWCWVLPWLLCLGCHSLELGELGEPGQDSELAPAVQATTALGFYAPEAQKALQNHMTQAALCLEQGDQLNACLHLARHLDAHPEQLNARMYYAELLLRLERVELARCEFERFIRLAQEQAGTPERDILHGHTRLMEIGEIAADEYSVRLHRGIGMYLLAQQWARVGDDDGELSVESLLCKAAGELALAAVLRPGEARPRWYLHLAWSCLGQSQPAQRALRQTQEASGFSELTPAEQRGLVLALAK